VWEFLKPHLTQVQSIDFTGGGEPLLQPHLIEWIKDARAAGCETGLLTNGLLLEKEKAGLLLDAELDWICFSVDGADADTYESIRIGSNFKRVTKNIAGFCSARTGFKPKTMINFVIMAMNAHQMEDIVRLAANLGVDQVNFKQCDVIRGEHGKGLGLFAHEKTHEIKKLEKFLAHAEKAGRRFHVKTTAFSFTPEELPVCAQDPRDSLFIRYDGVAAPCINLAIGGPTTFLGRDVIMPSVHYGRVQEGIDNLWDSDPCRFYKERFTERIRSGDEGFFSVDQSERSLQKLKAAKQAAIDAMPAAPEGCRVCHYLYGI
jgi:MoaA/NifB/PqqE/SkfB family radical SAM enzyme